MRDLVERAWDNWYARVVIVGTIFGWLPFYLLTEAQAVLLASTR